MNESLNYKNIKISKGLDELREESLNRFTEIPSVKKWSLRESSLKKAETRMPLREDVKAAKETLDFYKLTESTALADVPLIASFPFKDRKYNLMPGINNIKSFIDACEKVGKPVFKIRTTNTSFSSGDIKDAWVDLRKHGWSVRTEIDDSLPGFNEVYVFKKISPKGINFGEAVKSQKKRMREADSDYIKIGNTVYPNTPEDFDGRSVDTVLKSTRRAYDQEQADKVEAARKAELEKKAEIVLKKIKNDLETSDQGAIHVLFDHLVPSSGKADTVAGELVRAMMRLLYRDFNDGDVFYDGYGRETCASSAAYLCEEVPNLEKAFRDIVSEEKEEGDYTDALEEIAQALSDYILNNPYLLAEANDTDSRSKRDYEDYFDDDMVFHEFEVDLSGDLQEYINYGVIDYDDVESFLENLMNDLGIRHGRVNRWAYDAYDIEELSRSELEALEENYEDYLRGWLEDLENEYGSIWDLRDKAEEEEEDEEDDEEEEDLDESLIHDTLDDASTALKAAKKANYDMDTVSVEDDISKAEGSIRKAKMLAESESSPKLEGTWEDILRGLEEMEYQVPRFYFEENPRQWIFFTKDGKEYEAEVTRYSNGKFELMLHNICALSETK